MVSKGLLGGFVADRRGNIATIAALTFSVTLGAAAFGVDIGKLAADKRKLQSAADLAASSPPRTWPRPKRLPSARRSAMASTRPR